MSDDNNIPIDNISNTTNDDTEKYKMSTNQNNNNIFVKKSPCPQILICSLVMVIIFCLGLALVITYPYFHYISEHGESQCDICNCQVDDYTSCSISRFGELCTSTYTAIITFSFNNTNTSFCNHQDTINVDDYYFCDNLHGIIPCYYENSNPTSSVQLSYFVPYGGIVGISLLSFSLFITLIITLTSLCCTL